MQNNRIETRWCIEHERHCSVFFTEDGIPYHLETCVEETISGEQYAGYEVCHGPFTMLEQPEPLSEAEWTIILSRGEETEVLEWQ
jgi:hypothetical protein